MRGHFSHAPHCQTSLSKLPFKSHVFSSPEVGRLLSFPGVLKMPLPLHPVASGPPVLTQFPEPGGEGRAL